MSWTLLPASDERYWKFYFSLILPHHPLSLEQKTFMMMMDEKKVYKDSILEVEDRVMTEQKTKHSSRNTSWIWGLLYHLSIWCETWKTSSVEIGGNLWMWLLNIIFQKTAFMCDYSSQATKWYSRFSIHSSRKPLWKLEQQLISWKMVKSTEERFSRHAQVFFLDWNAHPCETISVIWCCASMKNLKF